MVAASSVISELSFCYNLKPEKKGKLMKFVAQPRIRAFRRVSGELVLPVF